ncbi:hypothetical protein [Desulfofalx alkaliphila]|uniref:hypothetical protein n=1 Tax=Desulfofalx alkaliphila TaxID=105483 RepID=UPI0004E0BE19|nr:hypothetical protein [Desulfofalx alkaliphila]
MIVVSFLLIIFGIALFMVSVVGAVYRLVNYGGWPKNDAIYKRWLKLAAAGIVMGLLGQLLVWAFL